MYGRNYLSLLCFYGLLYKILRRYGFSGNCSALAVTVMLFVNVPLLRTLCYVQVNIHVANLILLCLLLCKKRVFLSALALAVAVHMKSSPVILVLPFILGKRWKWLIYFTVIMAGIVIWTSAMNGFEYYSNCLDNVRIIFLKTWACYRENSIDSFVRATLRLFLGRRVAARFPILFLKAALLLLSMMILFLNTKRKTYYRGNNGEAFIYNSFVVLIFLMMMFSPVVWEHHPVFIIFPFLLMLKKISGPGELSIYLAAYYLIFLMPTFDFYPLSYNRLLGVVLCYVLFLKSLKSDAGSSVAFEKINRALEWRRES